MVSLLSVSGLEGTLMLCGGIFTFLFGFIPVHGVYMNVLKSNNLHRIGNW